MRNRHVIGRVFWGSCLIMALLMLAGRPGARAETVLKPLQEFGTGRVLAVAYSKDGSRIAVAGNCTVQIFNPVTGQNLQLLAGHTDLVVSVGFSADGSRILTGSWDGTAKLWDASTGTELRTFNTHKWRLFSAALSLDGSQVLTVADTVKLWNAQTGAEVRTFTPSTPYIVAFSPDGNQILTGSYHEDGAAILWNAATGEEIRSFAPNAGPTNSLAFSPDGAKVLTGSGSKAKLWDAQTGAELRTFSGHANTILSVAISADGSKILTGSGDKTAKLWDAQTGTELRTISGHAYPVYGVAFSPDGGKVLTGSYYQPTIYDDPLLGDSTARLWNAATGEVIRSFNGHDLDISTVAFSPDGRKILTGSSDQTAKLWDVATGAETQTLAPFNRIYERFHAAAFSPDGSQVLLNADCLSLNLWNVVTGALTRAYPETMDHSLDDIHSVAFSPDGSLILAGLYSKAKLLDTATGNLVRTFSPSGSRVWAVAFSPDGRQALTSVGATDQAKLWDVATGQLLRTFSGHPSYVWSVAFSPDGSKILTACAYQVNLWDAATGALLLSIYPCPPGGGHNAAFSAVFSPDGKMVLTGSDDSYIDESGWFRIGRGSATLWNAQTGQEIRTFAGHVGPVLSVSFSPDGSQILTGSMDGTAMLWDVNGAPQNAADPALWPLLE